MDTTETVTGEKRFNSGSTTLDKPKFPLLPTGDYELKILGDKVSVSAPSESNEDGLPYISTQMEVTAGAGNTEYTTPASGKNQRIFPRFFLKVTPTEKGFVAVKARNSVTALAKAIGEDFDVTVLDYTTRTNNTFEILNPQEVAAWLKSKDGMTVKAHVKQVKGGTYTDKNGAEREKPDSNEIQYFIVN